MRPLNILIKALVSIGILFIVVVSGYVSYLSTEPLFLSKIDINKVHFSYLPLPTMFIFGFFTVGISITLILLPLQLIRGKKKESTRWLYIPLAIGMTIGTGVNYANYYWVIKPNNMIECPQKIGYKKNLMHDYVADISLCEKF